MNKRELAVMENVFWAEVEGRLPFQTKSKLAQSLADRGLLECVEERRRTPLGQMTIAGYCLTHAGRFAYCDSCRDVEVA